MEIDREDFSSLIGFVSDDILAALFKEHQEGASFSTEWTSEVIADSCRGRLRSIRKLWHWNMTTFEQQREHNKVN